MKLPVVLTLVLLVCRATFSAQTTANDSLTIDEAINRVLATHPAVSQARAGVDAAMACVGEAQSGYYPNLAADAVRNARIQYDAGAATNLELLDTETSLAQARLGQVSAGYQYTLSRYSLDRATGMLQVGTASNTGNR